MRNPTTPTLAQLHGTLDELAAAARAGDADRYRAALRLAEHQNLTTDQIKDAHDWGRAQQSLRFNWRGHKHTETEQHTATGTDEHTFLVAVTVDGAASREAAEYWLHDHLPQPGIEFDVEGVTVESWWVAEDDRRDRSDCDSAVFVPKGSQHRTHL